MSFFNTGFLGKLKRKYEKLGLEKKIDFPSLSSCFFYCCCCCYVFPSGVLVRIGMLWKVEKLFKDGDTWKIRIFFFFKYFFNVLLSCFSSFSSFTKKYILLIEFLIVFSHVFFLAFMFLLCYKLVYKLIRNVKT